MEKKTKKKSVAKKLIPATSMLLVSATMLASSTYAWFTMSREVEVKNISMTATTPEDIQLSLGAIGSPSEANSLAANGGYLSSAIPAMDTDWANIADISHYYRFGKLIPASSTDGANVFFTADSAGVKEGDYLINLYETTTLNKIMVLTKKGNYIYIPINDIPMFKWKDLGKHVSNFVAIDPNDEVVKSYVVDDRSHDMEVVIYTKDGMVKKISLNDLTVSKYNK